MKLLPPMGPESAPETGLFNTAERKRMVSLAVLFTVVLAMIAYGWFSRSEKSAPPVTEPNAPQERPAEVVVITPEVDAAAIEALVDDATPGGRVVVEGPALEAILEPARLLNDGHYAPMEGALLDETVAGELIAAPAEARCKLLRARGFIDEIGTFDGGPRSTAHYRGRLRLEGGGHAWFAVVALPEASGDIGDFVRIDGLFLKVFRRAGADGEWIEAPMIVGPRAVPSFPGFEPVTEFDTNALLFVEDDGLGGISGQPFYEYWRLLSYAQNVEPGTIDWSQAPVLDEGLMLDIQQNSGAWRGVPIRVPPALLFDIWDQAQGENPARLEKLAEAWAGNEYWTRTSVGVIRFVAPFERGELRRGDVFTGRGFFLRNHAYERLDGNLALAPFFVMHSLEPFTPVEDETWATVFSSIALALVAIVILTFVGVMRDRKKTQLLQAELRRRRRARRAIGTQPS